MKNSNNLKVNNFSNILIWRDQERSSTNISKRENSILKSRKSFKSGKTIAFRKRRKTGNKCIKTDNFTT
jgi:hypothetical protein